MQHIAAESNEILSRQQTTLEPEWEGHVTLEFFQHHARCLPRSTRTKAWRRCLFFESMKACSTSYRDRGGKVHGARKAWTLPKT